ncbi:hypothetical protein GAQ27_18460, partial [Bacteroides uniformis]
MEIITRKRTVWLTFLDVLYKKKLPLQSIHAKGVPFFVTPVRFKRTCFRHALPKSWATHSLTSRYSSCCSW